MRAQRERGCTIHELAREVIQTVGARGQGRTSLSDGISELPLPRQWAPSRAESEFAGLT